MQSAKHRVRVVASVVLAVLSLTIGVVAYTSEFDIYVSGLTENATAYGYQFVSAGSSEGVPYVKVRMIGYTDWVEGSSYWCLAARCAVARAHTGVAAAGGIFTAEGEVYIGGERTEANRKTKRFNSYGEEVPLDDPDEDEEPQEDQCSDPTECEVSPILIPTGNSQAYRLTKPVAGVVFDIRGDGVPVRVAWTPAGAELAFLALDRNGNGTIDSGAELFGDHTLPGVGNGFKALDKIAPHNNDGMIDAQDPLFAQLLLWTDRNHNGYSESNELRPASDVLEAVGLGYVYAERRDGAGNRFSFRGWARRAGDGSQFAREFKIYDVFLKVSGQ
jgi:hypothetical protein